MTCLRKELLSFGGCNLHFFLLHLGELFEPVRETVVVSISAVFILLSVLMYFDVDILILKRMVLRCKIPSLPVSILIDIQFLQAPLAMDLFTVNRTYVPWCNQV